MAELTDHYETLTYGEIVAVRFLTPVVVSPLDTSELRSMLLADVDRLRPRTLIFDFRHVRQISSDVVFLVLQIRKRLVESPCEVRLASLRPAVLEVFQCMRLEDSLFPIFETFDEALHGLTRSDRVAS